MKLKIDKDCDTLYFRLNQSAVVDSEEVKPGVVLDFDEDGQVVGIEILNLSARVSPDQLRVLQFEN